MVVMVLDKNNQLIAFVVVAECMEVYTVVE